VPRRPKSPSSSSDSLKLDLSDYLPYLVNRVGVILAEQFTVEELSRHDLSIAMWRVLVVLAENGGQRQIDLAGATSIDVSTLSRLVTRLVRMGLVSRTRSATSNREVIVKLDPRGRAALVKLVPIAKTYEALAMQGISRSDLAITKRSLRRMYDNMARRTSAPR
jgi:MarR family transcriptional regulator, organic hydroperoxide resistance regulator